MAIFSDIFFAGDLPQAANQQPAGYRMNAANGAYDHTQRQASFPPPMALASIFV